MRTFGSGEPSSVSTCPASAVTPSSAWSLGSFLHSEVNPLGVVAAAPAMDAPIETELVEPEVVELTVPPVVLMSAAPTVVNSKLVSGTAWPALSLAPDMDNTYAVPFCKDA